MQMTLLLFFHTHFCESYCHALLFYAFMHNLLKLLMIEMWHGY